MGLKPEKGSILFNSFKLDKKIKQFYIDIKNFDKINNIIKKKNQILFFICCKSIVSTSYTDPLETFGTNVIGSTNVLEAKKK